MHTPGPWNWNKYGDLMGPACVCVIERESGVVDADAYLIASAPDLLAALRSIISAYEDGCTAGKGRQAADAYETAITTARAAIRKATGKE
jgi:hypothetical protein